MFPAQITSLIDFNLILIVGLIIAICCGIAFIMKEKRYREVKSTSLRLKGINEINTKYSFSTLPADKQFRTKVDSKNKFDHFSPYDHLLVCIEDQEGEFESWTRNIRRNQKLWNSYSTEISALPPTFVKESYLKAESDLASKATLKKPVTDLVVEIVWTYTSPKGQNHYQKRAFFTTDEVEAALIKIARIRQEANTRQAQIRRERALMTPGLRYEVLKRDNFTCQICGSTQNDGVKLEVDHIHPVSKGGKTEFSNLQTLCDRCNRGKRDKI
ncbi:MAG: HNH endonuclease [Eggerthellaceae bacterium]